MDDSAPPVVVAEVKWTIPCQGQGRVGRPAPCPAKQGRLGRLDNTLLQQAVTLPLPSVLAHQMLDFDFLHLVNFSC